ncbi:MAG: hypothetical protein R3B47_07445 [Bacteroidia bacterium]
MGRSSVSSWLAGGPLIVGLILGRSGAQARSSGRCPTAQCHPSAARPDVVVVGHRVRSGAAFVQSFTIEGLWVFLASAIISLLTALLIIIIGYKVLKKPFTLLMGMVANQPAILDFATSRAGNTIPVFGFRPCFPLP